MAIVPEFISVLRKIRDVIYPEIKTTYEDSLVLKESIDVGKVEFDADLIKFNTDYSDFNTKKSQVDASVLSASQSASSASQSALTATNKSNEIKAITAQSTTGAPGTSASASYNPTDGKFTFVIPQGSKGNKGESFTVNSSGATAQRELYDAQPAGWSFLDITTSTLYFKASNTSGDWSSGVPFGKGDTGDTGDTGVGIESFTYISTNHISGLPAQSGGTDTYRATLTNALTFDYQVYNGLDADLTYVDEQIDIVQGNIDTLSTQSASHIPLGGVTAYHLLQGNLSVSNEVITNGFSTTLYTGNGTTQSIDTGIDMATQHGNDASETFGGLSWLKSRSNADGNALFDTVRGVLKPVFTNTTAGEAVNNDFELSAFNNNGFSVLDSIGTNRNLGNFVSWNFQTTHRKTGVTNHGKAYTEHYNPYTGFTIIKYEGSGLAGHEIPHSLGRKLGLIVTKNLNTIESWISQYRSNNFLYFNQNVAEAASTTGITSIDDTYSSLSTAVSINGNTNQYIMYGWANSYFDETNKLIGNYEIGVYQGTGVASNKIVTRGKPAWVMIKRIDSTGSWRISDNMRTDKHLEASSSSAEISASILTYQNDGFTNTSTGGEYNASGGQYLYMIVYDNDSGSGKSKYPKATDTSNVQINNAIIPFAQGIDSNGTKVSTISKNESITGLIYNAGKNYVYSKLDGTYGVKPYEPRMLSSELVRRFAGEQPDYYDVESNKWFNTDAGSELVTNGKFNSGVTTGWTALNSTLSIVNNTLRITTTTNSYGAAYQTLTGLTIGKKYRYTVTGSLVTATHWLFRVWNVANTLIYNSSQWYIASGSYYIDFIAQETSLNIEVTCGQVNGATISIDNISVFPADIIPTTEITESRNYLNHIVHADQNGQVAYVEELPKIEYKDIIKANEYQGKNACTAWVNLTGSASQILIRDKYNIAYIIRVSIGVYDIYFEKPMDNINYSISRNIQGQSYGLGFVDESSKTLNKCTLYILSNTGTAIDGYASIQIFGGKN